MHRRVKPERVGSGFLHGTRDVARDLGIWPKPLQVDEPLTSQCSEHEKPDK